MIKQFAHTFLAIGAAAALSACGGGGGGANETPSGQPILISANAGPAVSVDARGGISIEGTASTTRYQLSSMAWTVQPANPSSEAVIATNDKCDVAQKTNTPGVNNGGQSFTSSSWVCSLGVKVGAPKVDTLYNITLTATDSNGGVTSSSSVLTVKAATVQPLGPVSVTAGAAQDITSGATVDVSCLADGGTTASGSYTWQWVQTSNPDLPIRLANTSVRTTSFVAPVVATTQSVNLECRATDDAATTGRATKSYRILPAAIPQSTLRADAGSPSQVAPGSTVTLNGSATSWYDAQGVVSSGPLITYSWLQTAGPSISIANPTTARPTFDVPSAITERTTLEFQLTASSASQTPAVLSTAKVSVIADPAAKLGLSLLDPVKAVGRGDAVTIWGLTTAGEGTKVYYSWSQIAGPEISIGGSKTANAGLVIPPSASIGTTYVMRVQAGFQPISVEYPGVQSQDMIITVVR